MTIQSIALSDIGDGGAQMRVEMKPNVVRDSRMAIHGHRSHDRAGQIGARRVTSTITIMTACACRECPESEVKRKSISGG